ncbi:unnamed protein product, partial [Choristocarpus tenellus]
MWLLLHHDQCVAAQVLRALAVLRAVSQDTWITSLMEQGCIPVLRMAGRKEEESGTQTVTKVTGRPERAVTLFNRVLCSAQDEACGRHLDRLVRTVATVGNHQLRVNVAVALVMLSLGLGNGRGQQTRKALVIGGGVDAILGMLRSPVSRTSAILFLRMASALIWDSPPPSDVFA